MGDEKEPKMKDVRKGEPTETKKETAANQEEIYQKKRKPDLRGDEEETLRRSRKRANRVRGVEVEN